MSRRGRSIPRESKQLNMEYLNGPRSYVLIHFKAQSRYMLHTGSYWDSA